MASISLKYKSKNGNLTAPGDVDPGAMIPIATVTIGAGGSSYAEFTSIPSNYEHLQVRGFARSTAAGSGTESFMVRFNSDTGTNYSGHILYGTGTAVGATGTANLTAFSVWDMPRAGELTNTFGVMIMDVLDYSNTNKYKTARLLGGMDTNGYATLSSGSWRSTSAIDTIRVYPSGGNFAQYSSFALYGIKRAGA